MIIQWGKLDPKTNLSKFIAGDEAMNMTIQEATELSLKRGGLNKDQIGDFTWSSKHILDFFGGKKKINDLTIKDGNDLYNSCKKKVAVSSAYRVRCYLSTLIKRVNNIESNPYTERLGRPSLKMPTIGSSPQSDLVRKFRVQILGMEELTNFILPSSGGKYQAFKMQVMDTIRTVGEKMFFGIQPLKGEPMSPKEIRSRLFGLNVMFKRAKMPWTSKWSETRECFVVYRTNEVPDIKNK